MNSDKLLIIDKILCFTAGGIMEELPLTCAAKQQVGETRKKRLAQRLAFFRFDNSFGV